VSGCPPIVYGGVWISGSAVEAVGPGFLHGGWRPTA